jgi:uncharacterized protein (TIGR03066 family)
MALLRVGLAGCLLLLGLTAVRAEEKKGRSDAGKAIGSWEVTKGETLPAGSTLTMDKDGKLKLVVKRGDQTLTLEGTYKLDGKKLSVTLKGPGGKENTETMEVTKLTDTELVTVDEQKKTDAFKKKK